MASLPSWHSFSEHQAEPTTARPTSSSQESTFESHIPSPQDEAPESPTRPSTIDEEYVHLTNSQTVSSATDAAPSSPIASLPSSEPKPAVLSRQNTLPLPEPKRCWICQLDSTEDEPASPNSTAPVWRKPCPCSLEAHDDCLLQWIAASEQPKKGELSTTKKLVCPQCGHAIKIRRPRDLIVSATEIVTWASRRLIVPTLLGSVVGTTYSGLWLYGWSSLKLVFGLEEALKMTGYALGPSKWLIPWDRAVALIAPCAFNGLSLPPRKNFYAIWLGLPLVMPALILLRTKLADQLFSLILPIYFISPQNRMVTWPPSPGLSFALLPSIRTVYNSLYSRIFSSLEKKWDLAVQRQPREGETAEQIAADAANPQGAIDAQNNNDDDDEEIEVVVDENVLFGIEIEVGDDVADPNEAAEEQNQIANGNLNANLDQNANPAANPPAAEPHNHNHPHIHQRRRQWAIEGDIFTSSLGTTLTTSLLFPAFSSTAGNILLSALPLSYTLHSSKSLLKHQWGRSLVGGCLLVVLKDMVLLYCKWKKARDFGKREVVDYVKPKGEKGLWERIVGRT